MAEQNTVSSVIRERIKRLQLLDDLLRDPEMAAAAREALAVESLAKPGIGYSVTVGNAAQNSRPARRRNPSPKRRGTLIMKALDVVKASEKALTAKEVAERMRRDGFAFGAKSPNVAVSKALRTLAEDHKIEAAQNGHARAAIHYSRIVSSNPFLPMGATTE
jgi:hypothetical protein